MNASIMRLLVVCPTEHAHAPAINTHIQTLLDFGWSVQMVPPDGEIDLLLASGWYQLVIAFLRDADGALLGQINRAAAANSVPLLVIEPGGPRTLPAWLFAPARGDARAMQHNLVADLYPDASVLLADLVDFSTLTHHSEPTALLHWIDQLFAAFDAIVARHGLMRIKTIGDAYLAVAGVPAAHPHHARAAALAALEMQHAARQLLTPTGRPTTLRIGLSSGALFGGAAGHTDGYDVWGVAVNTASRLQQLARPNMIHVAAGTHALAGDRFRWLSRGNLLLKGIGLMQTYYLLGQHQPARQSAYYSADGRLL